MMLAPIALFVYNRPWHTQQTVEALLKNEIASESELFIFSDAAKNSSTINTVNQVRAYIKSINGFKVITIVERIENFGLANSIIDGVTRICNEYGTVIVLEDDLVTSPYFLAYMNDALRLYRNSKRVISIHGYVYPVKETLPETFFIKGADCWGWATWKRGWDLFDANGQELLNELSRRRLINEFDFNGTYAYYKMLEDQINKKNDSWAIRWYASAFLADKLTLYPGRSLVRNIGNDSSGTHCGETNIWDVNISQYPIKLTTISIEQSKLGHLAFEKFFKSARPSFMRVLLSKVKRLILIKVRVSNNF